MRSRLAIASELLIRSGCTRLKLPCRRLMTPFVLSRRWGAASDVSLVSTFVTFRCFLIWLLNCRDYHSGEGRDLGRRQVPLDEAVLDFGVALG